MALIKELNEQFFSLQIKSMISQNSGSKEMLVAWPFITKDLFFIKKTMPFQQLQSFVNFAEHTN